MEKENLICFCPILHYSSTPTLQASCIMVGQLKSKMPKEPKHKFEMKESTID